jgi:Cof subfamily protein (haloacid dehalogenase superfamily)
MEERGPEIRLVVVDLDGTLLNSDHKLSQRNEQALRAAMAQGVQVAIATGKTRFAARELLESLQLNTPGVFVQGTQVTAADGRLIHEQVLPTEVARHVISVAEADGFTALAIVGERVLVRHPYAGPIDFEAYGEPRAQPVGPLQNVLATTRINKLLLVGERARVKALRWRISQQLQGAVMMTEANLSGMLEVLPAGSGKGVGVKALLRHLDLSATGMLAIGDGENDLDMVRMAAIGVAVANADSHLRAAADHVVASNDENGVAEAIERFVLAPSTPAAEDAAAPEEVPIAESATAEEKTARGDA